ncbi:hypothetical protein F511_16785 [Dorcoceras hygrometricum]|uniref:Uncharacterized protein n=1 Tax=Dorcoceras hygrometricum TaxID=472368 RepID=A0A2Z7ADZ4_9LAMI|nr:hypothetical protein F511_16785 [Dorcoceras hygrometricum]
MPPPLDPVPAVLARRFRPQNFCWFYSANHQRSRDFDHGLDWELIQIQPLKDHLPSRLVVAWYQVANGKLEFLYKSRMDLLDQLRTQTTQKQEKKYEVKPQYEELSKQLIMQHAIIDAMQCMRDIKDRIARPVYQLANHLNQPLYPHDVSNREIIGYPAGRGADPARGAPGGG